MMQALFRIFLLSLAFALSGHSFAKSKASSDEDAAVSAILSAANDRIVQQIDFWFDDGQFPRVIQLLKVQNELDPTDYEVATNLGWMHQNVEEWDAALAVYIRYRNENLADPDRVLPEVQFYFMRRVFAKIPPLAEPVLKEKPHPNVWRLLAHSYDRLGLMVDCVRVWQGYLALYPNDLTAKENLRKAKAKLEAGKLPT